jgi:hypothetical protein
MGLVFGESVRLCVNLWLLLNNNLSLLLDNNLCLMLDKNICLLWDNVFEGPKKVIRRGEVNESQSKFLTGT